MTATVERQAKAWNSALRMSYVRKVEIDGRAEWALFDSDGEIVHHSVERSSAFFFAANRDVRVVLLN